MPVNRKPHAVIRLLARVPVLYQLAAFTTARRVVVRGRSMAPTLEPGERVLFDRLAYVAGAPTVGDIVLARSTERPGMRLIKRVADGEGLAEGEYWLLGDNSDESTDSRTLGAFRLGDVLARAWLVYWPAGRFRVVRRGSGFRRP